MGMATGRTMTRARRNSSVSETRHRREGGAALRPSSVASPMPAARIGGGRTSGLDFAGVVTEEEAHVRSPDPGGDGRRRARARAEAGRCRGRECADRGNRRGRPRGAARRRCRRADLDAGDHRHPHPLRRPGDLGQDAVAVALARRHHRGHGQLRVWHRALPAPAPRSDHAQSCRRRRHGPRRPAHRHQLGVRELRRISRRGPAVRALRQSSGFCRPFGGAHRGHGRGRLGPPAAERGRTRRNAAPGGGGDA